MWSKVPVFFYRGGTSRALFFFEDDLPRDPMVRDKLLLYIMGQGSGRINGIGGTVMASSKIVLIRKSSQDQIDIEYTHGQVSLDKQNIDYTMNGANIAFAVGLFAVHHQFVATTNDPQILVKALNLNTNNRINILIPFKGDPTTISEDTEIELRLIEPHGEITSKLFP